MAKGFINPKTGEEIVLLNPHEKGRKAAYELKHDIRVTNRGDVKKDKKGRPKRLSDKGKAYRMGYLQARKDSAKAWKANQKKAKQRN